jgi:hypothetical protein
MRCGIELPHIVQSGKSAEDSSALIKKKAVVRCNAHYPCQRAQDNKILVKSATGQTMFSGKMA